MCVARSAGGLGSWERLRRRGASSGVHRHHHLRDHSVVRMFGLEDLFIFVGVSLICASARVVSRDNTSGVGSMCSMSACSITWCKVRRGKVSRVEVKGTESRQYRGSCENMRNCKAISGLSTPRTRRTADALPRTAVRHVLPLGNVCLPCSTRRGRLSRASTAPRLVYPTKPRNSLVSLSRELGPIIRTRLPK